MPFLGTFLFKTSVFSSAVLGNGTGIAHNHHVLPSTCHSHIEPAEVRQEADHTMLIGANQRDQHGIRFLTLHGLDVEFL